MPDRDPGRDRTREHELERELRELGAWIDYPPTPDLSRAVRHKLEEERARDTPRSGRSWATLPTLRWAAAAVFVLAVAIPSLSPGLRATVADWFVAGQAASTGQEERAVGGAGGAAKESPSERLAEEAVRPASGGGTGPVGDDLGFGERITLRKAKTPTLLPRVPRLGKPNEVYSLEDSVTLVYRARPGLPALGKSGIGLLLTQLPGGLDTTYLAEEAHSGKEIEEVRVDGERGYWILEGRSLESQPGKAELLPGGALLWEQEGRALLMRTELSKAEAILLASSVS